MSNSARNLVIVGLVAISVGIVIGGMLSGRWTDQPKPTMPTYEAPEQETAVPVPLPVVPTYQEPALKNDLNSTEPAPEPEIQEEPAPIENQASDSGSDIVHVTRTGTKYHRGGCRYLSKSDIPITRKEAIAQGYTPCSVCNP